MDKILIMRDELTEIVDLLSKFPGATYVELEKDGNSGIGYRLKAAIPLEVEGTKGTFTTDIVNEQDW